MSKAPGSRSVLILMFMGALGVGALAYYVKTTPKAQHVPPEIRRVAVREERPHATAHPKHTDAPAKETTPESEVLVPRVEGEDVVLAKGGVEIPSDADPRVYVSDAILKMMKVEGVHTLGVDVRSHTAVVTYSKDIDQGFGSMEEGQFIKALQVGFGQFPEVDHIELRNGQGEPIQSLGEHVDLSEPIDVIRPGEKEPATSKPPEP